MGNCIIKESSLQWGGEDWSTSVVRESDFPNDRTKNRCDFYAETERTSLLEVSSVPKASGTKVKIRIPKKQLSYLLRNAEVEAGPWAQQVLARLTDASGRFDQAPRRSWTPSLQSIPE